MTLSPDGNLLFVGTPSGVRMVSVDESHMAPVAMTLSAPAVTAGDSFALTATLNFPIPLSGIVNFHDGTVTLASVPLINNTATFQTTALSTGVHTLTVTFTDAALESISVSRPVPVVVAPANSPAGLVPITSRNEVFVHATRNHMLMVSPAGYLFRYDLAAGHFLDTIVVGGSPLFADITPDASALYLTDSRSAAIRRVDLTSGTVLDIPYTTVLSQIGSWDIAVISPETAWFDTEIPGSGWVPLRTLNLATNTLGTSLGNVLQRTSIFRSHDRSTVYLHEGASSAGPISIGDTATATRIADVDTGTYLGGVAAVSRNGQYIAADIGGIGIRDRSLNILKSGLGSGAVAFSPVRDELYILPNGSNMVQVWDLATMALRRYLDLGDTATYGLHDGAVTISDDGKRMYAATSKGVRMIPIPELVPPTPQLTASAILVPAGQPVTFVATLPPGSPTGYIQFREGATLFATIPLAHNQASFTTSSLTAGGHNVTAAYTDGSSLVGLSSPIFNVAVISDTLGNLLPILNHADLISDAKRKHLIIPSSDGRLFRYDMVNRVLLPVLSLQGMPGFGDITPDGQFLYLTDQAAPVIHKVNLDTGTVTQVSYTPVTGEGAPWDLAIVNSSAAIFGGRVTGPGVVPVRALDLEAQNIAAIDTLPSLVHAPVIHRSADAKTALFAQFEGLSVALRLVDTATNAQLASYALTLFLPGAYPAMAGVSRDGKWIATNFGGGTRIFDRNLQEKRLYNVGAVGFSPVLDRMYHFPVNSSTLSVYDTTTFTLKTTLNLGEKISADEVRNGILTVSADGTTVFVTTPSGIRWVNVQEPASLQFQPLPTNASVGQNFSASVAVFDAAGNPVTDKSFNITLSVSSGPAGGSLSGTLTVATVKGVATFSNLKLSAMGAYALRASTASLPNSLSAIFMVRGPNQPPTIAAAAAAALNAQKTGAALTVLGADDDAEGALTYTWAAMSVPSGGGVTFFEGNGTNEAKAQKATFTRAGAYTLRVTVRDSAGLTVTSTAVITVGAVVTRATVTPATAIVQAGKTQTFAAALVDQFGLTMAGAVNWTVSGGGTINSSGVFTAASINGGPYTVTATSGNVGAIAQATVTGGTPAMPTNLATAGISATGVKVTWTLNGGGESGVYVMRWNGTTWLIVGTLAAGATTFTETGLSPSTTYYYDVIAYNGAGTIWAANYVAATTKPGTPPSLPTELTASAIDHGSVKVTWKLSGGETYVSLKRWTGSTWIDVANLPAGTMLHTVTGLAASTRYLFHVVAVNAYGGSWAANYVAATTFPQSAPPAATNLRFTQLSTTSGRISWQLNGNVTSVYVAKWSGAQWQIIAVLPAGTTSFLDPGLWVGASFHYVVITANAFGTTWAASYVTGKIA